MLALWIILLSALALVILPFQVHAASRQCRISEAYSRSTFDENRIRKAVLARKASQSSWNPPIHGAGAVVSVYSYMTEAQIRSNYPCQIENRQRYCDKHGYKCYVVGDSRSYVAERSSSIVSGKNGYWMKFQVLKDILGSHPWVLYLDMDAIFNQPHRAPSIESLLAFDIEKSNISQASSFSSFSSLSASSVFMPRGEMVGWGTYFMLLRNTEWAHHFVEHLWSLRRVCPDCLGEQCGAHISLFDAIIRDVYPLVQSKELPDEVTVNDDRGRGCCDPVSYCLYPEYYRRSRRRNTRASSSVQGCVWQWQTTLREAAAALNLSNNVTLGSGVSLQLLKQRLLQRPPQGVATDQNDTDTNYKTNNLTSTMDRWSWIHPHISWRVDMAGPSGLNLSHPVKQMTCKNGEYYHELVLT